MSVFSIGNAKVDFDALVIDGDTGHYSVEPKVLDVLQAMMDRKGEVIDRETLIDEVWGVSFGGDERLSRAVSLLRKALGDDARNHRYIETIPKRGYRLIAEFSELERACSAQVDQTPEQSDPVAAIGFFKQRTGLGLFATIVLVLGVTILLAIAGRNMVPGASFGSSASNQNEEVYRNSIAVLPFSDLSADNDQRYLADGLAEELINSIAKFPDVRVVGRTSSFRFRSEEADLRSAAAELNVRYVLTGSVRKQRNQIRVAAQLIEVDDSAVIWSEVYDGDSARILEFQEKMAQAVASELDVAIAFQGRYAQELTSNQEAYDLFVQGRYLSRQFGQENKLASLRLLNQATEIDPNFAAAWAWIGRTNLLATISLGKTETDLRVGLARAAIGKALALDPDLAMGHYAQALLHDFDLDLEASQDAMERALAADPNQPFLIIRRGVYFSIIGQMDKAEQLLTDGLRRDPTDAVGVLNLARVKAAKGEFEEALELTERSIDLGFVPASGYNCAFKAYVEGKDSSNQCWSSLPESLKRRYNPPFDPDQHWERIVEAYSGPDPEARRDLLALLNAHFAQPDPDVNSYNITAHLGLGAPELFMERLYRHRYPFNVNILAQIWLPEKPYNSVRQHSDFPDFAEKIGLVRAWEKYGWPPQCQRLGESADGRIKFECS